MRRFKEWECSEALMRLTGKQQGLYLHCLPADISGVSCRQGEVGATVFDRYRDPLYFQASHKPYVIAAMIFLARFARPVESLSRLLQRAATRIC
jgi:ornithine carbamoyltransferase